MMKQQQEELRCTAVREFVVQLLSTSVDKILNWAVEENSTAW
jgi:hypothetical protein